MQKKSPRIHQPSLTDRRLPREASLWRRFRRTKCPTLREELVLGYTPLVVTIAGRVHRRLPPHVDRRDLVSSGMVGLLAAVDGYDPEFPNFFAAYAAPRILGAIIDSLRESDLVPRSVRERGDEIQFLSLEEPTSHNGIERPSVGETIPDARAADPATSVVEQETVRAALRKLSERERQIVALHYFSDMSFTSLADLAGVTPARLRTIHAQAMMRLQRLLEEPETLEAYDDAMPEQNGKGGTAPAREVLTPAELDVLRAAAEGMSADETADQLIKSTGTIRTQRKSVLAKLQAKNMAEAVWLGCKKGYLSPAA
jgi:RNA polymerase sigma factor for flagellar operon FliA